MPTTGKGLPYPATTAAPNVPADLQALADALDFTRVQQLTAVQNPNASNLLPTYPAGISMLNLGGAEASAGLWPSGSTLNVLTMRHHSTQRGQQFAFRSTTADPRLWFRQMSDTANAPWVLLSPWTTTVTLPDVAANGVQSAAVTFPAATFTGVPVVAVSPAGSNALMAGCVGVPTATGVTVYARNATATVVTAPKLMVTVTGSY